MTQPFGPQDPANPYQNMGMPLQPPPRKSSSIWLWLLGGLGCGGVLLLLCCGGATYFGVSKGMGALGDMVKNEVADNDDVKENLGELTSVTMNFMGTANEQKARGNSSSLIVFDAQGTEGKGQFVVETAQGGQGSPFNSIELKLPDGTIKKIK